VPSPFSSIPQAEWIAGNGLAFAIRDRYPVSPGHTLVITRREVPTWFDATREEQIAILDLVEEVKRQLDRGEPPPDGYNVGFNAGPAAGQTVPHLHVHVIPRYAGDMDDPRGGVRHVIPSRGNYAAVLSPSASTGAGDHFLRAIRPLFTRAHDAAIVAAFIQDSGLEVLYATLLDFLRRPARLRILTGDYLQITQAEALERLLDWTAMLNDRESREFRGSIEARIVEVARLAAPTFHPKAWRFEGPDLRTIFVGSSNISRAALEDGIEWNLRIERDVNPEAYDRFVSEFDRHWDAATPLTARWLATYRSRRPLPQPEAEAVAEGEPVYEPAPKFPHVLQSEALDRLAAAREEGRRRALVVMATGLGKTWLVAFDLRGFANETGRMPRVLFLAHRSEILLQAAATMREMFATASPVPSFGRFVGDSGELDADFVFASVQKLARPSTLARIAPGAFDYVVLDEVHHAEAPTYRRILAHLDPRFLVGLTATPDRADEAEILPLFDDFLCYEAGIPLGIRSDLLAPFAYFGIRDEIDYREIPWRNGRFDIDELTAAASTARRMEKLDAALGEHPGAKSLVFCCSIRHALFVRDWLRERGVAADAVFAAEGSDDRDEALSKLRSGELDAICSVDLFNEGVDVPDVDRIVMLRPTESPVVFLQQLGRGLRKAVGKEKLTVVDFVGNHKVFLRRLRTLLSSAGGSANAVSDYLTSGYVAGLPPECTIEIELEAKEMLASLLPRGASVVETFYLALRDQRETRPRAVDLLYAGYDPAALRAAWGSWFEFVKAQGDLGEGELAALDAAGPWLRDLETTRMNRSYKMVLLQAFIDEAGLHGRAPLERVTQRSREVIERSPELLADAMESEYGDPRRKSDAEWQAYWRENPLRAWTSGRGAAKPWFTIEGADLVSQIPPPPSDEARAALTEMTAELIDYRLAVYRRRSAVERPDRFTCRVLSNGRTPIIKLPSLTDLPSRPVGEVTATLPDGSPWVFRFAKEFCNVAWPADAPGTNRLPDLLRSWFGEEAGQPGTRFDVTFAREQGGWTLRP
jgi:superfamily II DNA or RNA helicase/diadenosine tetraphosphate (Ap4A) HIT family hydrolase